MSLSQSQGPSQSLGHRQTLSHRQTQRQELRLTQVQRLELANHQIAVQLSLIQALCGEEYAVGATCPECSHELSPAEILKGFNSDPNDFTTGCPECGHRFTAKLTSENGAARAELAFFCSIQVLDMLKEFEQLTPQEIQAVNTALFHSAIFHFGSLWNAFRQIGIGYTREDFNGWQTKATPFLGRVSDPFIAGCVGVSTSTVRRLRNRLQLKPFTRRQAVKTALGI